MLNANVVDSFAINDSFSVSLPTHQMSAIMDNRIYIFGGSLLSILRNISYFDLSTYKWVELNKSLDEAQAGGVAISDPNNKNIILIGGKNEMNNPLGTVLLFNTIDNTLYNKEPLKIPRSEHTAVLYQDSILYVFGGKNGEDQIVSAVEKAILPLSEYATSILIGEKRIVLKDFELLGNYPNPFNPLTKIKLSVFKQNHISINIFNIQGKKIKTLYNNLLLPGIHSFIWDATNDLNQAVASGIYFYTISSGKLAETKRMLLIR